MMRAVKLAAALAIALALSSSGARADEEDLTDASRPGSIHPSTLAVLASGGSNFAPYGTIGGALSYFNEAIEGEVEVGAGAGFPGVQVGVNLRKLFGANGDYLVFELGLGYNHAILRGVDPGTVSSGSHAWTNLGLGYEHRAGWFVFGFSGGVSFSGFSQTPSAHVRASAGVAIF